MRALVVDGSNVGKVSSARDGSGPALLNLAVLRDALGALQREYPNATIVAVVDRHEAYRDDVPAALREEVRRAFAAGEFEEPPVNVSGGADGFILRMADQHDAVVVSNDAFKDYAVDFPWLADGDRLLGVNKSALGWTFALRSGSKGRRRAGRGRDQDATAKRSSRRPGADVMAPAAVQHRPQSAPGASDFERGCEMVRLGEHDRAIAAFEQAADVIRQGDRAGGVDHAYLGVVLDWIGCSYMELGEFDRARSRFEQAVAATSEGDLAGRVDHDCLGRNLSRLADTYVEMGEPLRAVPLLKRAVEEIRIGDLEGRVDHEGLSQSLHALGRCYSELDNPKRARLWFEQAVEEAHQGNRDGRIDHDSVSSSLHWLGSCHAAVDEYEQARRCFREAVEEARRGDLDGRVDHAGVGHTLRRLGDCYVDEARAGGIPASSVAGVRALERARPCYEQAAEELSQGNLDGRVDHASVGYCLHWVGVYYDQAGDCAQAIRWLERAVAETRKVDLGGYVDGLGSSLGMLGRCYLEGREYEQARSWYEQSVEAYREAAGEGPVDHDAVGWGLHWIGVCHAEVGEYERACRLFEQAIEQKRRADLQALDDGDGVGESLHWLGLCHMELGHDEQALVYLEQAVEAHRRGDRDGNVDHDNVGRSLHRLGSCHLELGRSDHARPCLERAVEELRLGDVEGRVDRELLRESLLSAARCLRVLGAGQMATRREVEAAEMSADDP